MIGVLKGMRMSGTEIAAGTGLGTETGIGKGSETRSMTGRGVRREIRAGTDSETGVLARSRSLPKRRKSRQ
jgi:hypothetical protein